MKFKLRPDMGWVMAKAIIISIISVLTLLPVLAIYSYKLIDKTEHKPILPSFERFNRVVMKLKTPILVLASLLVIPALLASEKIL